MAFPYVIREAVEADFDTLVDFTLREAAEAEGLTLATDLVTAGVRAGFSSRPVSNYWVAVDGSDSIVASTSIVKEWSNFHGGYYWWIQSLYIHPDHRRIGLLEALLDKLTTACRSAGALELRLHVKRSNLRAIRAYRRCGFIDGPYLMMAMPSSRM